MPQFSTLQPQEQSGVSEDESGSAGTHHFRSRSKAAAPANARSMSVTARTSQPSMSASKDAADAKAKARSVTAAVSQAPMSWLKFAAPSNADRSVVAAAVSHAPMSSSKKNLFRKRPDLPSATGSDFFTSSGEIHAKKHSCRSTLGPTGP